ncbi:hypothetical protein [Phormidium sp. CCY1219]|uniref:hypothetical protein n=1 Tax=Phormidium sp. CCY1219 TaxID=2886104 RepID=UPI002D1F2547|nr:hypothetical protein [Phormidium sp. CCY1219]MEB3829560.1 hypothetical protein [Phormidium sp. CCY1219]
MVRKYRWFGILAAVVCLSQGAIATTPDRRVSDTAENATENLWAQADSDRHIQLANQCSLLIEEEQFQEAIEACNNALELKPDYSMGLTNRCVALGQINEYQQAVDSCRRALTGDGNWGDGTEAGGWNNFGGALLLVASAARTQKEAIPLLEQALAAFDQSLELEPDNSNTQQLREELAQLIEVLQ